MPHVTEEIWSQLPARDGAPDRVAVAGAGRRATRPTRTRSTACRRRRAIFRRSGVAVELEGDEQRIFEAVVRPGARAGERRTSRRSSSGCASEIERAEGMLANERFVANAAPDVVEAEREKLARYRRELDALGG